MTYSRLAGNVCFAICSLVAGTSAFPAHSGYDQPPKNILDVLHSPSPPIPVMSADGSAMLLVTMQDFPSISRVALPFLRLAGARVEIGNHSKHDTPGGYGVTPCATSYELVRTEGGAHTPVAVSQLACLGRPRWSADGKKFAFTNTAIDSVELWVGDAATGAVKRVPGVRLNPMLEDEMQWMPDQKSILIKMLPANLGNPPPAPMIPPGPSIEQSGGDTGESSTYENRDTLTSAHDEDLFDYYARSQIALVDVATLKTTPLGVAENFEDVDVAPDGRHVLVARIHKPYSYVVTAERFPRDIEVWDIANQNKVVVTKIAAIPLTDRVPIHGVQIGPRDYAWRSSAPATLVWAEALDGGDWKADTSPRDKVMMQAAPFQSPPVEILRTAQRFGGFEWGEKPDVAIAYEYDANKRRKKAQIVDVDHPEVKPDALWELSIDEKYANPGSVNVHRLPNGEEVIRQDGDFIYLSGAGASPKGDRPFLDRFNLKTHATERLFRSNADAYDQFLTFAGPEDRKFVTWDQSVTAPPNAFLRAIGAPIAAATGEATFEAPATAITHIADPTPQVRAIKKRLVTYQRNDGLPLSFTLLTPPGYVEGTRVPTILYAYPLDYAEASAAGQVSGSQATFTRLRQYQLLLLAGYAIIDRASFPVIGDPKKAYDTFLEQLTADAQAAVNEAVRLGVADPDRIGVTGHSHGALMTADLLAHTDLFRAGVATSGSYNKTLTPFGFQSERRSVWEAPDVYLKVSPFFSADKMKLPILIMHGAEDANPGTTPLQSQRLFEAIRGNGGTTRLVMLPHEPHWYSAMESQEQQIYEMVTWFDKYVKNAPPRYAATVQ